jgi:threo-3-hydroxy-L-aspartate ammonia-lyase
VVAAPRPSSSAEQPRPPSSSAGEPPPRPPRPEVPSLPITPDDVAVAARTLTGVAHRTPVLTSRHLDETTGGRLHLKAEHLQRIGAFKFRGAYNAVSALADEARARGVVAFSSGNHAQAVALAAGMYAVPASIVMPEDAPPIKVAATRGYGAEVVTYDRYSQDRVAIGQALAAERGATVIPPYDDPHVMAGQGTVALELLTDVPEIDLLVVPVGGGGLISGCAVAAHDLRPDVEVVGVEPADRRAARDAMGRGEVVTLPVVRTLLDGQQTPSVGARPLAVMRALVDRVIGVTDAEVVQAMRTLLTRTKQLVEPSGAAALAAVLSGHLDVRGRQVGIVLSGGNVAPDVLARILSDA